MKYIEYSFAFLAMIVIASASAMARTVEIKMSQCPKPYVDNLRTMTATLGNSDELILNFDKPGKYVFDGSLKFNCNTVIKGLGPNDTKVIVREGFNAGKSKMRDDTFFGVRGTTTHKVKAEVRDISFELASHKGILWEKAPKHIVKLSYCNGVVVDNIVSKTRDAVLTNLDLRNCSNVLVQNSEFENYNNCEDGGNLWSRGNQKNITVRNNVFRKYGKDEVFGCWGGVHDKDFEIKNVVVENNEFVLDNKTGSQLLELSVLISFSHAYGEGAKTYCTIDSIYFKNNRIRLNAPIKRVLKMEFSKFALVKNIEISNNEILNTSKSSSNNSFMNDFEVVAESFENTNVKVTGNYVRSQNEVLGDGHTFLSVKNANIKMTDNIIESDYPFALLWCHGGKMKLDMLGNSVSNLKSLALLSSSGSNDYVHISAKNNEFSGDTRIACRNVKIMDLNINNNVFNSSNYHFFLLEAAEQSSVVFEGNTVNSSSGNGTFYANYSKKDFKFTNVKIEGNTFNGLKK